MTWFDRHAGEDARAFFGRLAAVVDESGLEAAINAASGPIGLRRFVVRGEVREGRVRVSAMEGPQLPKGGGPPAPAAWATGVGGVETALTKLRRSLPRGVEFSEFALGVVRHEEGRPELNVRFDEDVKSLKVGELPAPTGTPAPTEDPAYLRALAAWSSRVDEVRGRFTIARGDWSLNSGRLDDGERRLQATALASWHPAQRRFEWWLDRPAGEEAPFVEPDLVVDLAGAIELACFAAARIDGTGVFQGTLETGVLLFVGLRAG